MPQDEMERGPRSFVELSAYSSEKLRHLAKRKATLKGSSNDDQVDVLKKAIALYQVAVEAAEKGQRLVVVDGKGKVVEKIEI